MAYCLLWLFYQEALENDVPRLLSYFALDLEPLVISCIFILKKVFGIQKLSVCVGDIETVIKRHFQRTRRLLKKKFSFIFIYNSILFHSLVRPTYSSITVHWCTRAITSKISKYLKFCLDTQIAALQDCRLGPNSHWDQLVLRTLLA